MKLFITFFIMMLIFTCLSFAQTKFDPGIYNPIVKGIKFAVTYEEVQEFLKQSIAKKYQPLIDQASDVGEADKLLRSMQIEQQKVGENLIKFEGNRSGWDVSVIKDEFMHNTQESMIPWREGEEQIYLFFIKDVLWKIVIIGQQCIKFSDCVFQLSKGYGPPSDVKFNDPETRKNPYEATWESSDAIVILQDKMNLYNCMILKWIDNKTNLMLSELRGGLNKEKKESTGILNPEVKEAIQSKESEDVSDVVDDILGIKKEEKEKPEKKSTKKEKKK